MKDKEKKTTELALLLAEKLAGDEEIKIFCVKCGFTAEDVARGPDCPQCGTSMVRRDAAERMMTLLKDSERFASGIPEVGGDLPFKEAEEVPWIMSEGKYFHCMFHTRIPECSDYLFGGDTTGLIWNFDDEPHSLRVVYRMRYYNSPDPHDSKDEKNWYVMHVDARKCPLKNALKFVEQAIAAAMAMAFCSEPPKMEVVWIRGDYKKATKVLRDGKVPWIHHSEAGKEEK